jgi:hypothetical protein
MKKEMIFFILIISLSFVSAGFFDKLPDLSPYIPDFAPFDASVTIAVNLAPIITDLNNQIYVCEDESLSHYFNVSDNDANLDRVEISPASTFFVQLTSFPGIGESLYGARIFSAVLGKGDVGSYSRTVSAIDDESLLDSMIVDIDVIEINHPPIVDNVGVQTVYTIGEDSSFYRQVLAYDVEDGNQDGGNLVYDLEFLNSADLFSITPNGIMNFTPSVDLDLNSVVLPQTYDLRLCVLDQGIGFVHPEILNECGQDGGAIEVCQVFSITVVDDNRRPIIDSNYPIENNFSFRGTEEIYFNITDRDPDGGIPDSYWYVDGDFKEYDNSSNFDEFRHTFDCGVSGIHSVRVDSTDGLLNDSFLWNISVENVGCPSAPSGGGGGGGGGFRKPACETAWACNDWNICQDLSLSVDTGRLSIEDSEVIQENCRFDFFKDDCGFQLRGCFDVNACNTTKEKPEDIGHCLYVENPSCKDGVKNCHSGQCEVLVDCGGSCDACPTCSDGKKNQGERGVDCEGPCPNECPRIPPILQIKAVQYSLAGSIMLVLVILIIQVIRIFIARRKIGDEEEAVDYKLENDDQEIDGELEKSKDSSENVKKKKKVKAVKRKRKK